MSRCRSAVVLSAGSRRYVHPVEALALVSGGFAEHVDARPLVVRMYSQDETQVRIRSAFVPSNCRAFIAEYVAMHDLAIHGKPYGVTSPEYLAWRRAKREWLERRDPPPPRDA